MRKISVILTDEQYAWVKGHGRLYLREVVEALMTTGSFAVAGKKKWWKW